VNTLREHVTLIKGVKRLYGHMRRTQSKKEITCF